MNEPARRYMFDEYHLLFQSDALKDRILAVEGVPGRTYAVEDGRIFVFAKLVSSVEARPDLTGVCPLPRDEILALARAAWVSPREAIVEWGVVPFPYALEKGDGGYTIVHRPFDARVPGNFPARELAQGAMHRLLLGQVVHGEGDFVFRRQPLLLGEHPDPAMLPERPIVDVGAGEGASLPGYSRLADVEFEEGFAPIDHVRFEHIKALVAARDVEGTAVRRRAVERAPEVWAALGAFPLASLGGPDDAPRDRPSPIPPLRDGSLRDGDDAQEDLAALRRVYPELAALSDGVLCDEFASFQVERHGASLPDERDDAFLFHLLGQFVPGGPDAGEPVAYAFARDGSVPGALAFGAAWERYGAALARLERRAAEAMAFLREDRDTPVGHGAPVVTLTKTVMDTMRVGRKVSTALVSVHQQPPGCWR